MKRKFFPIELFFVFLFGLITSIAAFFWDYLINEDGDYYHLISGFNLFQVSFVFAVFVFSPVIISALIACMKISIKILFYTSYSVFARRRWFIFWLPLLIFPFVFGAASSIQGFTAFSYQMARQILYAPEFARQKLVEKVNFIDAENGSLASAQYLQLIVDRYPDDTRNSFIENRIRTIRSANALSQDMGRAALKLKADGLHTASIRMLVLSLSIFAENASSKRQLHEYRNMFVDQKPYLQALYVACQDRDKESLAELLPNLTIVFWESEAFATSLTSSDLDAVERTIDSICDPTFGKSTVGAFISSIEKTLFPI